jgi:glycerophosphoryl diester phosphodiesterase
VKVLLSQEDIVPAAKALGLGLMTYGLENDNDDAIVVQKELQLEGVIVDNVQALLAK